VYKVTALENIGELLRVKQTRSARERSWQLAS
jgi:hypothetical protein